MSSRRAPSGDGLYRHPGQPVPLVEAAGQIPFCLQPKLAKTEQHEGCGRDAVGVVVAVDDHPSVPVDGAGDGSHSRVHLSKEEWVGDVGVAGYEPAGLQRVDDPPAHHHHGRDEGEAEGLGQRVAPPPRSRR